MLAQSSLKRQLSQKLYIIQLFFDSVFFANCHFFISLKPSKKSRYN